MFPASGSAAAVGRAGNDGRVLGDASGIIIVIENNCSWVRAIMRQGSRRLQSRHAGRCASEPAGKGVMEMRGLEAQTIAIR